jgi:hypothetical protein
MRLTVSDDNTTGSGDSQNPSKGPLTDSIIILIEVRNTNDKPILVPLNEIIGTEDQWLNFTINATDDDIIHGDGLLFSTNLSQAINGLTNGLNYDFNQYTGEVSILPDNSQVGNYWVEFQVSDLNIEMDTKTIQIIIENVNDIPFIDISSPINKQSYNTSTLIYFDGANTTDDDLIHDDNLNFHWSSNISGELSTEPKFSSVISDIGWHEITLTVTDESNEKVEEKITIRVVASEVPNDKDQDKDPNKDQDKDKQNTDGTKGSGISGFGSLVLVAIIIIIILILLILLLIKKNRGKKAEPLVDKKVNEQNNGITTGSGIDSNTITNLNQQNETSQIPMAVPFRPPTMPMNQQQFLQQQITPNQTMPPTLMQPMYWGQQPLPQQQVYPNMPQQSNFQQQPAMAQPTNQQLALPKAAKIIDESEENNQN